MTAALTQVDWSTIGGRLKWLCPYSGADSLKRWREDLGVSHSQWSRFLNGHAVPSIGVLMDIAEREQANLDWIVFGRGMPRGGIQLESVKAAIGTTLAIATAAALRGEPFSREQCVDVFLSHYDSEATRELEELRARGAMRRMKREVANDPVAVPDAGRKKVP